MTIILNNVIALTYMPYMLRMLGQAEYGLYSLAASVVAYLTVLDLGFGNAIIRYTAKFRTLGMFKTQSRMYGMFIILYSIVGILCIIAGIVLYFNVDLLFSRTMTSNEQNQLQIMLLLMTLNLAVSFPLGVFGSIISGYENFIFQKSLNLIRVILNPIVMIIFLSLGYKAVCMVVITTIFNLVTLSLNLWYCLSKIKIKIIFNQFDYGLLKEISYYSLWIFLCAIIDRIYWSSGQFILGMYVSTSAVAIYALGIQFQGIYMGFSSAITSVLLPKVTSMVSNNTDNGELSDLFVKVGRIQFSLLGIIIFGFILFGKEFIILWAGNDYCESYYITLLFLIPLTIPWIQNLGFIILQAKNQMRFRSLTYLIISVVSLILSVPISKKYGGIGCACCVAGALILGQIVIMNIYYKYRVGLLIGNFWVQILKMSISPIVLSVVTYIVLSFFPVCSVISLIVAIGLYTTFYFILFWRFSLNYSEKQFLKNIFNAIVRR